MLFFLSLVFFVLSIIRTATSSIPTKELEALTDLYAFTDGASWLRSDNWFRTLSPCGTGVGDRWFGILCDSTGSHVTGILLMANNLVGHLSATLGDLTELTEMSFNGNSLSGSIPESLSSCTKLYAIGMTHNHLSGPLPSGIGNWHNLAFLHLDFNSLEGPIPPGFYGLQNLKYVGFYANHLNGTLKSFKQMSGLEMVFLDLNRFEGGVPDFPESIKVIGLKGNRLDGSAALPLIAFHPELLELQLQKNRLSGPLPVLQDSDKMVVWAGYGNSFSGSLAASYSGMDGLTYMLLQDNDLSGHLPPWLASFSERDFQLQGNPFSCPILDWATFTGATCKSESDILRQAGRMHQRRPGHPEKKILLAPPFRVDVDIFGMAKCPDMKSIETVFGNLLKEYPALDSIMNLRIGFIGLLEADEPTGIYSMHGQTEALGELFQICVMEHYSNGTSSSDWDGIFTFLECVNADQQEIPANVESCLIDQGLSYKEMLRCALSGNTKSKLQESVSQAAKFGAVWSPTIYMNHELYCMWDSEPCEAQEPDDFVREICKLYQGQKPQFCQE